jgi:hypothetical protein
MYMIKIVNQEVKHKIKTQLTSLNSDIYTGVENIQFKNRHPIFKALMKLEFEDVIRAYHKRINH